MAAMVAELYGKATGCCGGKGGSMHLIAPEAGMMGASAVVGTTIANAAGYAYALRYRRQDAIVASFFGDGATEEGVFAESAELRRLEASADPFCLRKQPLRHSHAPEPPPGDAGDLRTRPRLRDAGGADRRQRRARRPGRARARPSARVRAGEGPWFLEVMTYRWREHVGPGCDYHLGYRTEAEAEPGWPPTRFARLAEPIDAAERARIEREVEEEIAAAFAFAEASPFPEPAELMTTSSRRNAMPQPLLDERRTGREKTGNHSRRGRTLSYVEAVREATDQEMDRDPSVILFGLDVDDPKAIQGTTRGLAGEVRPGARLRHAAVGGRHDRGGHRHGPGRAAADPRPHPHGLPDAGDEPARQRRRQEPVHVRRPGRPCRWWCAR